MFFQRLATLLLIILAVYLAWRMSGIGDYIKIVDDEIPEESDLQTRIKELEDKKKLLLDVEQNLIVTERLIKLDKELFSLNGKLTNLDKRR